MGKIDNANHQLVIIELENLMTMLESILASDNPSAIINGAISYIILLTLEGISYMNKHKPEAIKYNFKGAYWNAHVLVSSTTKRLGLSKKKPRRGEQRQQADLFLRNALQIQFMF